MFTSYSKMTGLRSAKYLVVMVRVISCKIKVIKMHTAWQIFDISDVHTPCRDCLKIKLLKSEATRMALRLGKL